MSDPILDMVKETDALKNKFSFFPKPIIYNKIPSKEITLPEFVELTKSDKYKLICAEANRLKKEGTEKELREYKGKEIDYISIGGTFKSRKVSDLKKLSGYFIADVDDVENIDELKEKLLKDKYTLILFISTSGEGLKVGIRIPSIEKNFTRYSKAYYKYLSEEFGIKGKIDSKCHDISRACFVSYDPGCYYNIHAKQWNIKIDKQTEPLIRTIEEVDDIKRKSVNYSEATLRAMLKFIPCRGWGNHTFEIMCALIHYGKDRDKNYFGVFRWWTKTFDEGSISIEELKKKWDEHSLKEIDNPVTIGSFVNEAVEHGYKFPKKKEDKVESIEKSCIVDEEKKIIIEQCYTDKKTFYICYDANKDELKQVDSYEDYTPINGSELEKGAVMLPSEAKEYESEEELDKRIITFIQKWLDISDDMRQFALWNIKRSWVYEKFHSLSYLRALGDTGRGKSRYLDTLGVLHYKPIWTAGATTPAPIFRLIERWKGTLIIDEADLKQSDESQDIIKIINMGYEKGKFVIRCDQNDANKLQFFDVYCPKILATRRTFQDKAVEARCITEVMKGTKRTDICFSLTSDFYTEALEIRNQLLMYRFKTFFKIPEMVETPEVMRKLEPRLQQIVSGFVTLFSHDKEEWGKFEKYILSQQERLISERQESFEGQIVNAIYDLLNNNGGDLDSLLIDSSDIVVNAGLTNKKGEPLKPRAISSTLRSLGFGQTEPKKVDGKTKRLIPLEKEHIENLFSNFGLVTVVTKVTGVTVSSESDEINTKDNTLSKILSLRNNRNNRNSVTKENTQKTEEFIEDSTELIHHKCSVCGEDPCSDYDKKGKPVCKLCKVSLEENRKV